MDFVVDLPSERNGWKTMDINPLLLHDAGDGFTVADCRIVLKTVDLGDY